MYGGATCTVQSEPFLLTLNISRCSRFVKDDKAAFSCRWKERTPLERLSQAAALCSEVTVILAALALLVKPLRDKLLGLDKLTDALKCQLRHDMLHTYYRHREDKTIRQYEMEDFLLLYRGYKALGGNSFIDRIKSEIDEWEVVS